MTKRTPISAKQNIWFDSQQVDNTDLSLEQNYNSSITSSIISNHIGEGVLPEVLIEKIIFNSILVSGFLDGKPIYSQHQPSDNNFGNQLQINLTGSIASVRRSVKIAIIGLDFENNLQYETFYFKTNESQITKKHFTKVLTLLFNDFIGNPNLSMNLGGKVTITEARPLALSRDAIMSAQDVEPNLFFRDFFFDGFSSLQPMLQSALPLYNVDTLNIFTSERENKILLNSDVTTQIGQKFIATTNNIQKITFLLSVQNAVVNSENDLAWNGDLVANIYPLQSGIISSSDIAPELPIDFSPSNIPIAQISYNYFTLQADGILLDSVPQPVDFIFSNSLSASGNTLIPGNYYTVTLKRSGAANKCDILIASGNNTVKNSRVTTFSGALWVDLPDEDLWFQIWTDSAKISDGQAYDAGHGVTVEKTSIDQESRATIDYCLENLPFTGNEVYRAVISATTGKYAPVPDPRTGQPVLSRQQFVPSVSLLNNIDVSNLSNTSEPLMVGAIADKNKKFFDSLYTQIASKLHSATLINNELFIKIIDDATDIGRYDTSVTALSSYLLNGDFVGAKLYPNNQNFSDYYRIADATLCSMMLGDVDGDGIVTIEDLKLLQTLIGYDLNIGLPQNSIINTNGVTTTYINGYSASKSPFTNLFGINFQLIDSDGNVIVANTDGVLVAHPTDPGAAQFTSTNQLFANIIGVESYKLVLLDSTSLENYGAFKIVKLDHNTDVLYIRKIFLDSDVMGQLLRANIDGDFHITDNDGYLLNSYIQRQPYVSSGTTTYPAPATIQYTKIGTRFNVIKFKLEKFIDRTDDYSTLVDGRSDVIHTLPDIMLNDVYFASHNFYTSPVSLLIEKKLTWDESLIVTNSRPRFVPCIFDSHKGHGNKQCELNGIINNIYPSKIEFNSGKVDFFTPDNLIIGEGGEIHRPDGNFYKVDFEVGTIVLEIPDGLFGSERTINIMEDFISSTLDNGMLTGITKLGFPAMRFADCDLVTPDALLKDQLRFSVSVQSFSPNTGGLSNDGYYGAVVDGKMGVSIDYATGLLTLNFTNLFQDTVLKTLSTKIQINVFLKKGGFNNHPIFIDSNKVKNMLKVISIFSGPVNGGPSALVDLEGDVSGILPIIHGGTGLNGAGVSGTVLTSNGSGLNYQFIYDLPGVVSSSSGAANANNIPKLDASGLLDPSFLYKNPIYVYGTTGTFSNNINTPIVIGAFPFNFSNFILQGLGSIKLEVILETTNSAHQAIIKLYSVDAGSYIDLVGASQDLTTFGTSAALLQSDDLQTLLDTGSNDYIYEIHLSLDPDSAMDSAICKMARLTLTFNNP